MYYVIRTLDMEGLLNTKDQTISLEIGPKFGLSNLRSNSKTLVMD